MLLLPEQSEHGAGEAPDGDASDAPPPPPSTPAAPPDFACFAELFAELFAKNGRPYFSGTTGKHSDTMRHIKPCKAALHIPILTSMA